MNTFVKIVKNNRAGSIAAARGFTLTEVMIVVAIIGILSAIGYPSYMDSVRKGNRAEAKSELMAMSQQLERCMSLYGKYDNAACPQFAAAYITKPKGLYQINSTPTASAYTLTATPASGSPQANDTTACKTLTIDNTGDKQPTTCW
jgi:type IV pilus assembly protein PilE